MAMESSGAAGSGGTGGAGGTGGQDFSPTPPLVIGGDERPAEVDIPTDYDPTVPHPLVIVLHGFGADGRIETGYMQLFDFVDEKQFVLVFPDGTSERPGRRGSGMPPRPAATQATQWTTSAT